MCLDDVAKATLHWMTENSGYLQTAVEDLSDGEFDTLVAQVVETGTRSSIIEAMINTRENAPEPDETGLDEIVKYRRALLKELAWADLRKKELLTELGNNYPEEKVTRKPRTKK